MLTGSQIISNSEIAIGQLSEEAQETRHKEFRRYREENSRKSSRVNTNTDVLHILLLSSDPTISSLRKQPIKKHIPLLPEAEDLLIGYHNTNAQESTMSDGSQNSDYE